MALGYCLITVVVLPFWMFCVGIFFFLELFKDRMRNGERNGL